MIHEIVLTTMCADGTVHIAPMGMQQSDGRIMIAPFRPSTTLENVLREKCAVINYVDDVRVIAGALTGRGQWTLAPAVAVRGVRLDCALTHAECELVEVKEDALRPRLYLAPVLEAAHSPFCGFNRAQAAVVEAAILVSRLEMLPWSKIQQELQYLRIAVEKTSGPRENEAWGWLMEKVERFDQTRREQQNDRPVGECNQSS